METRDMAKTGLYVGTGAGIILFALLGVLPGSFIGGVIGMKMAEMMFGMPMAGELLPRLMVAVSMIMGVMAAAVVFIMGTGVLGWTVGFVADAIKQSRTAGVLAQETSKG